MSYENLATSASGHSLSFAFGGFPGSSHKVHGVYCCVASRQQPQRQRPAPQRHALATAPATHTGAQPLLAPRPFHSFARARLTPLPSLLHSLPIPACMMLLGPRGCWDVGISDCPALLCSLVHQKVDARAPLSCCTTRAAHSRQRGRRPHDNALRIYVVAHQRPLRYSWSLLRRFAYENGTNL